MALLGDAGGRVLNYILDSLDYMLVLACTGMYWYVLEALGRLSLGCRYSGRRKFA